MSEQKIEIRGTDKNQSPQTPKAPVDILRRLGCGLMLLVWFAILLIPGMMFWLATGGQLRISHADVPDPHQHPLLQVDLIMTTENRGLQITQTSIHSNDELNLCIQGDVNYLLWESDNTATSATYCQCYERSSSDADWTFTTQTVGACES
jgi:hypothetical protein